MSRKDTIIITVLINAGLLVVLFASALKTSETPQEKVSQKIVREQIEMPKPKLERKVEPAPVIAAAPKPVPKPVAVATPKPTPAKKDAQTVIVQNGDALEKIARRHGVSVAALMQANDLSSSSLKIGQKLVIPEGGKQVAAAIKKEAKYYTVRAGDSPWTIASKNKIKLQELLSLNDLDDTSAKKLKPGDKLRIE